MGDLGLEDWQDVDITQFRLGIAIGVFSPSAAFPTEVKPILWTDNPIGNMLYRMLELMVVGGVLQRRDEPDIQYRWNPEFKLP